MWGSTRNRLLAGLFAAALCVPAWAARSELRTATPGTLNYVEGQASVADQQLDSESIGSVEVPSGKSLTTQQGKAEILLTPGVFLRLGDNSSAKMVSPSLTNTDLALTKGEAMVEVDEIHPANNIHIEEDGANVRLQKTGLYDFDADHQQLRVLDGKATVLAGDRKATVKGGHELALTTEGKLKSTSFDKKEFAQSDDLYRWSSLRSAYLADANQNTARVYVADGWYGPGWLGSGWYWSPWYGAYTFLPANGLLYSPFGWGYYSPLWVYRAPLGGYYYHSFAYFHPYPVVRPGPVFGPGFRGGAVRAFHPVPEGELHARVESPHSFVGGFRGGIRR